jgi:UDP-3-O-[3-hydroxymyristoyl] glucosamine N-acyltransferase
MEQGMRLKLDQIADLVGGELIGDPQCLIEGAGPIDAAGQNQITFAEKGSSLRLIEKTGASAIIVPLQTETDTGKNLVRVANPRAAFAKVLARFYPASTPPKGIHPTAVIGKNSSIGDDAALAAGVIIGDRVRLGNRVVLHPHVVIGDDVMIGDDTTIYPQVTVLERCIIGRRCMIHAGTVIGSDGYGFVFDQGRHRKIPQIGIVQIDDDVEIGANNSIDRATFGKTWIQSGVKTDNLVHIAHNVVIGENSLIVAQVGISGSVTIGRHVILAGQVGIGGHISLGDGVIVGAKTGVAQSIPAKQVVSGTTTAMPHATWLRLNRNLPNLPDLFKQVRLMEKRLSELEKQSDQEKTRD